MDPLVLEMAHKVATSVENVLQLGSRCSTASRDALIQTGHSWTDTPQTAASAKADLVNYWPKCMYT